MDIAVIGAGPAGLTSAKQSLQRGHNVTVFERSGNLGGIWNPQGGGAYSSVRMQSSSMSFHFSDFEPTSVDPFPTLPQVYSYLREYARYFGVMRHIRFDCPVQRLTKQGLKWVIEAWTAGGRDRQTFDNVIVATGELWLPRTVDEKSQKNDRVSIRSVKEYKHPEDFAGQRVLVVGGGVSGADIASELVGSAESVEWSVRRRCLFLPRFCGDHYNDQLFSYIGRYGVHEMPAPRFAGFLSDLMPDYMRSYVATGLFPATLTNNAVHINEKIIPSVWQGQVKVRNAYRGIVPDGSALFGDGTKGKYDSIILCTGYAMPDYSFIDGFEREALYEHFFYWKDPTLAIVNTPVDAEAFGTACPYFEAIAGWVLAVFDGQVKLPDPDHMKGWCSRNMTNLARKRFYDCWLETIRIGIMSGQLPDPQRHFADYWTIVSSIVTPSNLMRTHLEFRPAACDEIVDLRSLKSRVIASLPLRSQHSLACTGSLSDFDCVTALQVPSVHIIKPSLDIPGTIEMPKPDLVSIQLDPSSRLADHGPGILG